MFEVPPTYYLNYYITLEIPFSDIQYSFHVFRIVEQPKTIRNIQA